jgi:transcriptional regulator with PAS, ATPase and Fis domain
MSQNPFSSQSAAQPIDGPEKMPASSEDYLKYVQEKQTVSASNPFPAADEKMLRIHEIIQQIKDTNVSVLVSGESGTGKEVIAQSIHNASNRSDQAFVAVNCAALPTNLLESELFGYEKGAFTGAHQRHIGKFELATNGTLLLDEITEMDLGLQAKLLRALQEKEIERIGGNGPVSVNTRIIATTNRDIVKAVTEGKFRQDLFYRLYVIHMEVPPLRQRTRDIEMLANHFLGNFAREFNKQGVTFSPDAKAKLMGHTWPGNVRELQNVIQRAVLLANGSIITANELPIEEDRSMDATEWKTQMPIGRPLKDLETAFILETLKHHQGNRTHAARTLGISLRTLRNKINEYTAEGFEVMAPTTGRAS